MKWLYSPYAQHDSLQFRFPLPQNVSSDIIVTTVYDASNGRELSMFDSKLLDMGFLSSNTTINTDYRYFQIHSILYRLLLNPSVELCTIINKYSAQLQLSKSIGLQIRMGGKLSNINDAKFMNMTRVDRVIQEVKRHQSPIVFVSTDTPWIPDYLKSNLNSTVRILHVKEFEIGHSASYTVRNDSHLWEAVTKRAIVDLMILKDCDRLLVTSGSSFGDLAIGLQQSYGLEVTLWPFLKSKGLKCSVYHRRKEVGSYKKLFLVSLHFVNYVCADELTN